MTSPRSPAGFEAGSDNAVQSKGQPFKSIVYWS
jgi:hypothetical protein